VTLEHEMSRAFQGFILSLQKPVVVCTVLTILLKSKRDNAFKMLYHSICLRKQEIRDLNSGLIVYTLTMFVNLQQCTLQTSRQNFVRP
jgi:hypothetical protein